MKVHFVKIWYAGTFVSEDSHKEIDSREDFKLPSGAYGYQFYNKEMIVQGKEKLFGNPKNESKTYLKGTVYTLEQVKRLFPESKIMISNMENNNWDKVIKCGQGFLPFDDNKNILIA